MSGHLKNFIREHALILSAFLLTLSAGIFIGVVFLGAPLPEIQALEDYEFINPSVIENLKKHYIINFRPLRDEFEKIQAQYADKTLIYFVYLNNASWVGLGEKDLFPAASTIKVPLALAAYKATEEKKVDLNQIYNLQKIDLDSRFGNLYKAGEGASFSLQDLLRVMLENSDNTAALGIFNVLRSVGIDDPLKDIYQFMGWDYDISDTSKRGYIDINLKTLANMFITLYDARFASVAHSNEILRYLDNSPFNDKIVAGVPLGMRVSHKVGITADLKAYSDCGIVYAPARHYILCAAIVGGEEKNANSLKYPRPPMITC